MKLSCLQENLKNGLAVVTPVAGKNTTLPILNNVLLKAKNGSLTLITTNLEIAVECQLRGKIENEGEITVQAKLLFDYLQLLPKETVNLSLEDQVLKVSCQKWQTKIRGVSHEDFPLIPELKIEEKVECNTGDFREALGKVLFAAAVDELRPEISGVLFKLTGDDLTLAATDSYRLAEKKLKIKKGTKNPTQLIIPQKTLVEILRMLGDVESETVVEILLAENQVMFIFNDVRVTSRLIDGQYPDYQQIIPATHSLQAKLSVEDLKKAVKSASLFSKTGVNDTHWQFDSSGNELTVTAANSLVGEQSAKLPAEIVGDEMGITLNHRYVLDGLATIKTSAVEVLVNNPNSPAVFKPVKEGEEDFIYLIMPIRQ